MNLLANGFVGSYLLESVLIIDHHTKKEFKI